MERKHRQQMSYEEINYLEAFAHGVQGWAFSRHVNERIQQKQIDIESVKLALRYGRVVEINNENCIVLRGNVRKGFDYVAVVVVDVQKFVVVTAWPNDKRDDHKTLKKGEYTWRVNAIELLKSWRAQ